MAGILLEKSGGVASVVIDRPPLNVLNLALLRDLRQTLDELDRDEGVDLVEIRGAGERAFSAGVDVKDHTRTQVPEMLDLVHGVIRKLMNLRQPTIAVVDGVCLGGGCELASSCDLVLASEESSFATPEITVGCFPPVALARFSSQIGYHRAAEMILTGRRLSAREAMSIGLVNRVVPRHQLGEALEALRGELLDKSRAVLRITLRGLREIGLKELSVALARSEEIYLEELLETEDVEEGVQAFVEKRKPEWLHR
ncbi:MAG: enoyl-CoA hydratase/isomerase family protein [Deltaproteobacteria bacterium]|nr:enoyl-CoA hydratase/isomerase family protein [Deltaproteobacteria bacterium]